MTKCLNSLSLGALYYPEINNWNISPGSHGKATLSANTRTISMDGNKWETVSPVTTPLQSSCLRIPWMEDLVGCSPWGPEESDTTERLHFHFSLSCIGEENGNPLQCSCLENPMDGGAWWAAVYGVAQSRTRLKRLSSSSSSTPATKLLDQHP